MDSVAMTARENAAGVGRKTMVRHASLQTQHADAEHTTQRSILSLGTVRVNVLKAARSVVGVGRQVRTSATPMKGPVDVLTAIPTSTLEHK